jgi:membrane protease YdiL (CAAX protease family)
LTEPDPNPEPPAASRPGAGTFTIEGRRAPALFVVGWLGTILGLGIVVIGAMSGAGTVAIVLIAAGLGFLGVGLVAGAGSQAIERQARGETAYRGPSPFLVLAAAIVLTLFAGILLGVPLDAIGLDPVSPIGTLIGLLLTAGIYLALVRLLVVGTGALSWSAMGVVPPTRASIGQLGYGAVLGVPLVFVSGLLALALSQVLTLPDSPLPPGGDPLGRILNVVSAAIIAPVSEEIFFRGFSTTAWLRALGERTAIVRGAIFFALVHVLTVGGDSFGEGLERALFAFIVRVPVALALGWVFVRRRSLYASIGMHAAYNGVPVLLLLASGG